MKNFYYFLRKFLYFLFFALCTIYIVGYAFQASSALVVGLNKYNFYSLIFILLSVLMLLILWAQFFVRTVVGIKLLVILLLIGYFWLPENVPQLQSNLKFNDCLEIGNCAEGLTINTKQGKIVITKETCIKQRWQWDDSAKECNITRKTRR